MLTHIRSKVRNNVMFQKKPQNTMLLAALLWAPCASANFPRTGPDTEIKQKKLIRLFWSMFANLLFTNTRTIKVLANVPIHGAFVPALSHVNSPLSNTTMFKVKLCI